ncbi:MAG: hypothetical protein ACXACU_17780 [Candidatus Hodarchaeales archaeon]
MSITPKTRGKTSICPVCQSTNIGTFPIFQTINYARTMVKLRGIEPIKNVSTSKNSVKTNEIIRCLDCGSILALGNRLNPYIKFPDFVDSPSHSSSKKSLNSLDIETLGPPLFQSYSSPPKDDSGSSFFWKKPSCFHLETLHSDPNSLFCHQCGKLTFLGKLYDKGLLQTKRQN